MDWQGFRFVEETEAVRRVLADFKNLWLEMDKEPNCTTSPCNSPSVERKSLMSHTGRIKGEK